MRYWMTRTSLIVTFILAACTNPGYADVLTDEEFCAQPVPTWAATSELTEANQDLGMTNWVGRYTWELKEGRGSLMYDLTMNGHLADRDGSGCLTLMQDNDVLHQYQVSALHIDPMPGIQVFYLKTVIGPEPEDIEVTDNILGLSVGRTGVDLRTVWDPAWDLPAEAPSPGVAVVA